MDHKIKTGISYFGNRNPRHFVSDLEEILNHNCNFIVHTFSENDQEFYKDTIGELISVSKDAGLECYLDPWGIGRVFGGETYSSFALKNRDACQVLPDGEPAPAACMNHPKFREFMQHWIKDAADMGAEVLFWDEPHFFVNPKEKKRFNQWYCICKACIEKFRKCMNKEYSEATSEEINRFQEESVVNFTKELCDLTRATGLKNAVCLLPFKDNTLGLSDWSLVASIPNLDIFGTDPYWIFFEKDLRQFVGDYAREVQNLCKKYDKEPQIWIQAYKIPAGREEELKEAVAVAYSEGIRNFAAWSYYGTAYMSYIRSDNPQKVWQVLGEVYGELQRGEWE
ncbi:MAG: hypothetical protein ACE5JB_04795 [bacterium]